MIVHKQWDLEMGRKREGGREGGREAGRQGERERGERERQTERLMKVSISQSPSGTAVTSTTYTFPRKYCILGNFHVAKFS